ncbi:MAG TPA: ABC transporter permease [Candidatus Andersenbacteria bacterium]|nr:ABC transporter permease [Candidatus Andersenbacteria bacterium]
MNYIGVKTLAIKEIKRSLAGPMQTLGAPIVSALMYFVIFGQAVGGRIGDIQGIPYPAFIMPGLVMMNILTTAFQGVGFAIMFQRIVGKTINDLLISPMSYAEIAAGFLLASLVRSGVVGALIFLTGALFIPVRIDHPLFLLIFTTLVSLTFSSFGLIAGLWAKNFEQMSIIPTFIIMPLSFLGGIFYSAEMLPPIARMLSVFNPVFYMMNGMRYGFYGISDVSITLAFSIVFALTLVSLGVVWHMLKIGYNLKS